MTAKTQRLAIKTYGDIAKLRLTLNDLISYIEYHDTTSGLELIELTRLREELETNLDALRSILDF